MDGNRREIWESIFYRTNGMCRARERERERCLQEDAEIPAGNGVIIWLSRGSASSLQAAKQSPGIDLAVHLSTEVLD